MCVFVYLLVGRSWREKVLGSQETIFAWVDLIWCWDWPLVSINLTAFFPPLTSFSHPQHTQPHTGGFEVLLG